MVFLSRPLTVLLLLCLVWSAFSLVPQVQAELMINEVLGDPNQDWDGDGTVNFRGDEWIEVLNNGAATEDLSDYWLRDVYGDDLHLQLFGTLEPGAVTVFYGSDAVAWQEGQGVFVSGFSINNTGDTLELLRTIPDQASTALVMIHRVTLDNHEVEDDRSSGWDPETEQWTMFDAWNPYNGGFEPQGTGCLPTPGDPNICVPLVPVETTSWDLLKSQYR